MKTYRIYYNRESLMTIRITLYRKILWMWWFIDQWNIRNSNETQLINDGDQMLKKLKTIYGIEDENVLGSLHSNIS